MTEISCNKFFQNESKFKVGNYYETLRVKNLQYGTYKFDLNTCDEIGTIIPQSEKFLGRYVKSEHLGYGDNGTRVDTFINDEEIEITNYLDYDGSTRFREVKRFIDERINYIKLAEAVPMTQIEESESIKTDHINKYLLNPLLVKEICSFMNPHL
jgi:hypothetical protein